MAISLLSALAFFLFFAAALPAQNRATLAADKGKLRVLLSGEKVADEEFSISQRGTDWIATGNVQLAAPGAAASKLHSRLILNAQGFPQRYEWSLESPDSKRSGAVTFEGGTASFEVRVDDSAPFTGQFFFDSPRVAILDNNFYHHYAVLARLYDWQQKGKQIIRVFIPQDGMPGEVTIESLGEQQSGAAKLELLRVSTADLALELYVSKSGMVRIAVPAANVTVERQ